MTILPLQRRLGSFLPSLVTRPTSFSSINHFQVNSFITCRHLSTNQAQTNTTLLFVNSRFNKVTKLFNNQVLVRSFSGRCQ